jgi:hypothetical protein
MHHRYPVFDEAFLAQIAAQLSKQRAELDRLKRAAASKSPDEKVKSLGRRSLLRLGDVPSTKEAARR